MATISLDLGAHLSSMPDETTLHLARNGDETAFGHLVAQHKGRVFALVARFAREAHQIDDLAQEVFIRAWQRLGQYREEAPFEHWLSRIAVHACYDFLRRQRRWSLFRSVPIESVDLPDTDRASALEAREVVEKALARLKPKERLVLTLFELEGHSVREIAALTGWSEANVKTRASRARAELKKILLSS